jgi:hypothetical protein
MSSRDEKARDKLSIPVWEEHLFSAISAGAFFIIIGAIFLSLPNLLDEILLFPKILRFVKIPNTDLWTIAPVNPEAFLTVYIALMWFSILFGFIQAFILALRFLASSPVKKKAETLSNLVFWLGLGYISSLLLSETITLTEYFIFWARFIMLLGIALIVRAIFILIYERDAKIIS